MILVDPRSGSRQFLQPLRQRLNGCAKYFELDSGDFCFEGNLPDGNGLIGIELKTVSEFLSSARSGRYLDQLNRMRDEYQLIYLLLYGIYRVADDGILMMPKKEGKGKKITWVPLAPISHEQEQHGVHRRAVYQSSEMHRFIASLELMRNVNVLKASSRMEVVWYIVNLYTHFQKPWDAHQSVEGVKLQVGSIYQKASVARHVASSLPGIGWELAGKAEHTLGSVIAMANASVEEWAGISWVSKSGRKMSLGQKRAEVIWKAIREGRK